MPDLREEGRSGCGGLPHRVSPTRSFGEAGVRLRPAELE